MRKKDSERVGPMLNPPHLGELIRESMEDTGWNVTEMAVRLHCERGTLSRLLNGKAGLSANMALALEDIGWGDCGPLDAHASELRTRTGAPPARNGKASRRMQRRHEQVWPRLIAAKSHRGSRRLQAGRRDHGKHHNPQSR